MEVEKPSFCKCSHTYRAQTDFRARYIRNRRRVFRLPRRSIKDAPVARFASLSLSPHKPNSGENPRKGAAAPFLVVLRGIVKGENRNSPLTILSFDSQRRFLSHTRKKAGLKTPLRKHSVTSQCLGTSTYLPPIYGWRHFGMVTEPSACK